MSVQWTKHAEDPRLVRLWSRSSNAYLHLSGRGETKDVNHSWLGLPQQADVLKQRAKARGEEWNYVRRGKNAHLIIQKENEL
jgi:hypothetical protein